MGRARQQEYWMIKKMKSMMKLSEDRARMSCQDVAHVIDAPPHPAKLQNS